MQKGVIADSALADIIELLPYMLVPGSDSIKKIVTDTLGTTAISSLDALPLVGKFVSAAKQGVGIGVAIFLIKYVILYLPFVALILASFLVTVYYLISVIIYLNLAPFLAAFAFARGQTEQLKAFFYQRCANWFKTANPCHFYHHGRYRIRSCKSLEFTHHRRAIQ
ncbi:MAG: hypothetical protein LRY68_10045 [Sulfurospirillum sp.]|nr:hypothetical protein [Sulfurospirillum sp.]